MLLRRVICNLLCLSVHYLNMNHSFLFNCASVQGCIKYVNNRRSPFNSVLAPSSYGESHAVSVSLKCHFKGIVVSEQQL